MQRPVPLLDDKSVKFNHLKQVVQDMEREILKELGFELYQITWNEQPHRLMYFYINLFKPNPSNQSSSFQNLTRTAFNYLNDSYKTNICTYFPFQMIVASCIYLAFKKTGTEMPRVAWWTIMETSLSNLKLGAGKIQYIYNQFKQLPKYEDCFEILNKLAKQKEIELKITLKYHEFTDRLNQSSASSNPMLAVQEAIAKSKLRGQNGMATGTSSQDKLLSSEQLEKKENLDENTGVTSLRDVASSKSDKYSKFSMASGRSPSRDRRRKSRSNSHKKSHKRRSSRSRSRDNNKDRKDKDKKYSSRRSRSRDRRNRSISHHKDKKRRSKSRDNKHKKDKQEVQKSTTEQQKNDANQPKAQDEQKVNGNGASSSRKTTSETPEVKQDKHRSPSHSKKEKNQRDRESASTVRDVREGRDKDKDRKERKKSRSRSHHKKSKKNHYDDEKDSKRKRSKDRKKDYKKSRSTSKDKYSKFSVPASSTQQSEQNAKITPSPPFKQDKFTTVVNEKSNDFSSVPNKLTTTDKNDYSQNGKPSIESSSKTTIQKQENQYQECKQVLINNIKLLIIKRTEQAKPNEQTNSLEGKKTLDLIQQIKSKIQTKKTDEESSTQKPPVSNTTQEVNNTQRVQANPTKPTLDLNAKLNEKFKQYDNKLSSSSIVTSQPQLSKQLSKDSINSNDDENNDNDDYLMRLKMLRNSFLHSVSIKN